LIELVQTLIEESTAQTAAIVKHLSNAGYSKNEQGNRCLWITMYWYSCYFFYRILLTIGRFSCSKTPTTRVLGLTRSLHLESFSTLVTLVWRWRVSDHRLNLYFGRSLWPRY